MRVCHAVTPIESLASLEHGIYIVDTDHDRCQGLVHTGKIRVHFIVNDAFVPGDSLSNIHIRVDDRRFVGSVEPAVLPSELLLTKHKAYIIDLLDYINTDSKRLYFQIAVGVEQRLCLDLLIFDVRFEFQIISCLRITVNGH